MDAKKATSKNEAKTGEPWHTNDTRTVEGGRPFWRRPPRFRCLTQLKDGRYVIRWHSCVFDDHDLPVYTVHRMVTGLRAKRAAMRLLGRMERMAHGVGSKADIALH